MPRGSPPAAKRRDEPAPEAMRAVLERVLGRAARAVLPVALVLGSVAAVAQDAPGLQPQPTPPAAEPPVAAIPAAEILAQADETAAELRRLEALAAPSETIQALARELARAGPQVQELLARLEAKDANQISPRQIDDQRIVWAQENARIEAWSERLSDRWKEVHQALEQIRRRRIQWERTRDAGQELGFPPELVQRVDEVLQRIASAQERLRERSEAIARLTERVSALRAMADAADGRLDAFGARVSRRLLLRDAEPLWAISGKSEPLALADQASLAGRDWLETLLRWLAERQGALLAFAGLFALALLGALALRRRSEAWAPDETLSAARAVASRPLAAATAFVLVVAVVSTPRLPGPLLDLVLVVAVFPVISLGLVLLEPATRGVLLAVAALNLLEKTTALGPDALPLRRLLFLAVTVLAAFGAAVLRRRRRAAGAESGWRAGVPLAADVAFALLLVSIAASVLGWVNLAEHLSSATLAAAFSAIAWVVTARAALALLPLVPAGAPGRWLPSLRRHAPDFVRNARLLIVLGAVAFWARGVLWRFGLGDLLSGLLVSLLTRPLAVGGLEFSLGRVLLTVAVLLLIVPASRGVRFVLREEVLPRLVLPAGGDNSVLTVTHYVVLGSGLLLAARVAGLGATELTVVFGALGVGIGFGLQNVVNNFVSGLILIFERPIKVGDRVETAQHLGIVTRIGIRASTVRTFDGAEVVVPNGDLISKELTNWTLSDQTRRLDLSIGVAYGSDPNRVIEVLKGCASRHPRVLADPPPGAFMAGFGDSALNFRLLAWVRVEDFVEVTSQLYVGITQALGEAGIEIPFPQRDLHVRSFSGPVPLGRGDPAGGDSGSR